MNKKNLKRKITVLENELKNSVDTMEDENQRLMLENETHKSNEVNFMCNYDIAIKACVNHQKTINNLTLQLSMANKQNNILKSGGDIAELKAMNDRQRSTIIKQGVENSALSLKNIDLSNLRTRCKNQASEITGLHTRNEELRKESLIKQAQIEGLESKIRYLSRGAIKVISSRPIAIEELDVEGIIVKPAPSGMKNVVVEVEVRFNKQGK